MKKQLSIIFLLPILAFVACKKSSTTTTNNGPYASLNSVFSLMKPQSITVNMDAGTGGSFYGRTGTRYTFPANAFVYPWNGATVTGNVVVEVNEYLGKGDMIFAGVLPFSNGDALSSGGEIYVNVTKNYQRVTLRSGVYFQASIPQYGIADTPNNHMTLFLGQNLGNVGNNINWQMTDSSKGMVIYGTDTVQIFSDSLGFCNADQFMSAPNYQHFGLKFTGVTIPTDTAVMAYAVYDNYRAAWPLYSGLGGDSLAATHVPNIPVHFVVFTIVNGNFYGGILGATPANDTCFKVNLTQTDPAAFKARVNAL